MKKITALVFSILTLLSLAFIWGQSMLPREESAAESMSVVDRLKPIFDPRDRIPKEKFDHYVRKTAHFTEYAVLGFMITGHSLNVVWKHRYSSFLLPAVFCLAAASADETIQIFSAGRGPGVGDVILDFFGSLAGLLLFYIMYRIFRSIKKKHGAKIT